MPTGGIPTAVVGAGRLARALLPSLGPAGFPVVAVASRRVVSARSAARGLAGARAVRHPAEAVEKAKLVLLAVPDATIEELARDLSAGAHGWSERIVLHHAGALGTEPLAPLARQGAAVGVLHPLQCLAARGTGPSLLEGARARVEGDRRGVAAARRLARALGMVPLDLPATASARAAYHAAASLLSNDVVALLDIGVSLLETAGLGRKQALAALLPLARGTLAQSESGGPAGALTGPVVRGDLETLRAHLGRLARIDPDAAEAHRLLSVRLARLASRHGGRASPAEVAAVRPAGRRKRTGL